jgi:F like protein
VAKRNLLRAADRLEPGFRRAFIEAVARANGLVPAGKLLTLLAEGRTDEAYRLAAQAWDAAALDWRRVVARQLREALESGAAAATAPTVSLEGSFDVINPQAVAWAQTRTATLVTAVSQETKEAIRAVITRSVSEGIAPREAARLIRSTIGLTARQEAAVANFRASLATLRTRAEGHAVETVLGRVANRALGERIAGLVARYAARLLNQRSLLIARTEIMSAANAGTRLMWEQAVESGELDGGGLEQEWLVADDERLCPVCEELDGTHAPIGGTFPSPGGLGPPAHPACRCTTGLVRVA